MSSEKHSKEYAITICGPPGVGKTSFANRLLNDSFPQTLSKSSSAIEFFALPDNKVKITVANKPAHELLEKRFSALRDGQFKEADVILIIIDGSTTLPSSEELQDYFKLAAGEDKNKLIHLVVNKMDELDEFTREAVKTGVTQLSEKLNIPPRDTHYISTKNSDGIPKLREAIKINAPFYHKEVSKKTATNITLPPTAKIVGGIALSIVAGIIAGGIAGFIGGPPLGIVVGIWATTAVLGTTAAGKFLYEKFKKSPDEMPIESIDNPEQKPAKKIVKVDIVNNPESAKEYLENPFSSVLKNINQPIVPPTTKPAPTDNSTSPATDSDSTLKHS